MLCQKEAIICSRNFAFLSQTLELRKSRQIVNVSIRSSVSKINACSKIFMSLLTESVEFSRVIKSSYFDPLLGNFNELVNKCL